MLEHILVIVGFCSARASAATSYIESPLITDHGDWGVYEECPPEMYVYGFQLLSEPDQGAWGDDTALNGIYLLCIHIASNKNRLGPLSWDISNTEIVTVSSTVGPKGYTRGIFQCPPASFAIGFDLRVDHTHGFAYDDTAANNLRIRCTKGRDLEGDAEIWGAWYGFHICPTGHVICGIQTQVEEVGTYDDTTLNNIKLGCCEPV